MSHDSPFMEELAELRRLAESARRHSADTTERFFDRAQEDDQGLTRQYRNAAVPVRPISSAQPLPSPISLFEQQQSSFDWRLTSSSFAAS